MRTFVTPAVPINDLCIPDKDLRSYLITLTRKHFPDIPLYLMQAHLEWNPLDGHRIVLTSWERDHTSERYVAKNLPFAVYAESVKYHERPLLLLHRSMFLPVYAPEQLALAA